MFDFLWLQPIYVQTQMSYNGLGSVSVILLSDLKSKINLRFTWNKSAPWKIGFQTLAKCIQSNWASGGEVCKCNYHKLPPSPFSLLWHCKPCISHAGLNKWEPAEWKWGRCDLSGLKLVIIVQLSQGQQRNKNMTWCHNTDKHIPDFGGSVEAIQPL